jgi:transcription elongation factor Elf1
MLIESTYGDDRWVSCGDCGWGGDMSLDIVAYGQIEMAEWPCGECGATNEYTNDTAWAGVDEYVDQMKEERAWP